MEKKTTLEKPAKVQGMLLHFDQAEFNLLEKAAQEIIPKIKSLKSAYLLLELKAPFDQKRFDALLNGSGATDAIDEFKRIVSDDLKVFKNAISRQETAAKIDQYANQLHEPLIKLRQEIASFNARRPYKLKTSDFVISENDITLNIDEMRKHFSVFLTSENQIQGYKRCYELAIAYNNLVDFLDKTGTRMDYKTANGHHNLMNLLFGREVVGQGVWGDNYGPHIEISKKNLGIFI